MTTRIHHTNRKALRIPYSTGYHQSLASKPNGVWYGVDWAWLDWCKSETGWRYKNNIKLEVDERRLLILNTPFKVEAFSKKYETPYLNTSLKMIDWESVAKKYSGIEIAPYHYSLRFKLFWYYGWDVASGCIWDLNAIKSTKLVSK